MNIWPLDRLRGLVRAYADVDFPTSSAFLYAAIADKLADDDEILELAATVRDGQPPPNLLFAAVHYLLLSGVEHPLAAHYPDLTPSPLPPDDAYEPFRDFCLKHRERVVGLIQSRLVQTNVLERCGLLLPAFAHAAAHFGVTEIATLEIGASAGLNLLWDHYRYRYADTASADMTSVARTWGDEESPVSVPVEVRGDSRLPPIPPDLRSVWRKAVDLDPVDLTDADSVLWQRALMWPERLDRQVRLEAARSLMLMHPVDIIAGDATELLPGMLKEAPPEVPLVVFASYTLYQFPKEARARVIDAVGALARSHPTALITLDTRRRGDPHGTVELTLFTSGGPETVELAHGHPHGTWIEWLA